MKRSLFIVLISMLIITYQSQLINKKEVVELKDEGYRTYSNLYDCSNLEGLMKKFLNLFPNKSIDDFNFKRINYAKSIEVVNHHQNEYAIYLDFDGDNGYAIFDDEKIYLYEEKGDLSFVEENANVKYSFADGFVAQDESGRFISFNNELESNYSLNSSSSTSSSIDWTKIDGNLYDTTSLSSRHTIDEYMSSKYPNYTFEEERHLYEYVVSGMSDTCQYNISKYYANDILQGVYSEENCAINAMYSYFNNLSTVKSYYGYNYGYNCNFDNGKYKIDISDAFTSVDASDVFIHKYYDYTYEINEVDENGKEIIKARIKPRRKYELQNMNKLYWDIRNESVVYGYNPIGGFNMHNYSEHVMETIAELYGYSTYDVNVSTSLEDVLNNLYYGIPVVIATNNSKTYGNHGMTIYGYRKYSYEVTKFLWIKETKYAYIWCVDDGWSVTGNTNKKWFDPNCESNSIYFITNRNTLLWPTC